MTIVFPAFLFLIEHASALKYHPFSTGVPQPNKKVTWMPFWASVTGDQLLSVVSVRGLGS